MLHVVDIHARYQAGLVASALAGVDFVITKATGGTSLVIDRQQATDERALEEHKRLWDELSTKKDK